MNRLITLAVVAAFTTVPALAQEKSDKKDGADATQGLGSPFQVGPGVTFLLAQDKKALTAGLSGQLNSSKAINFWQVGLTGTTDDEGKGLLYSTSDTAAPGLKAKIGFGYSKFLAIDTREFTRQSGQFLDQAWCIDVLSGVAKDLPDKPVYKGALSCADYFGVVRQAFNSRPPQNEEAVKTSKAILGVLEPIVAALTPGKRSAACGMFKESAKDAFKLCGESGEPLKSASDQAKAYPQLHTRMVSATLPSSFYVISGNYLATLTSASYRERIDGVVDLETKHQWTDWLHGASVDTAYYRGRLAIGVHLASVQAVEIALTKVCKVATDGDFRAESCKDAMLGKPTPKKALALNTVVALDPLVMPRAATIARPGAQFEIRYERPTTGNGRKVEIAVPIYLAPTSAPLKTVVGIRPAWKKDTTGDDHDGHFSVSFFIGARPGVN
jgi:hypothetical protein